MSYILRRVRPSKLQAWIAANAAGSLKSNARDSWRAYLAANSGTGATIAQMEYSFLKAAGATGNTLNDLWASYNAAQSGTSPGEKCRNKYQ